MRCLCQKVGFTEQKKIIKKLEFGTYYDLGHNRPLTLPEPEPTLPFDLPLSEPTYQHTMGISGSEKRINKEG